MKKINKKLKRKLRNRKKLNQYIEDIHIVMCCWKRFQNLDSQINMLNNQTVSNRIHFHLVNNNYILYSHDDMFFCKDWDLYLEKEVKKFNDNLFYLSGTNVSYKDGAVSYTHLTLPTTD